MPETGDLTYNKDMLNVEQPNGSITITKDHIQTYCDATGHPISQDESGRIEVPVNMLNVFFNRSVQIGSDVKLEGASVGLNAGRSIEVFDQVFEGDTLDRSAIFKEVYTKTGRSGTMAFEVWEILFKNDSGELVAKATDSMVYRAPGKPGK